MELTVEDKTMADHAESCERAWGVNWLAGIDTRYHPEHIEKHVHHEMRIGKTQSINRALAPLRPHRRLIGLAIGSAIRRIQRA